MKNISFILILIFLVKYTNAQTGWREKESEVTVKISNESDAGKLYDLHLNGDLHPSEAVMYVTSDELQKIKSAGLNVLVTKENLNLYFRDFWTNNRDAYHSYEDIIALMDSLTTAFPDLCIKINYGTTPQGREMSCLKISKNVLINENEPEVFFDGGIHGDEVGGPENLIRFARYLCTEYGSDPGVTQALDNREVYIYPMVNPDGRANMSRYNSNLVDCNRDGGYMWNGEGSSPGACSQPETRALRNCMNDHRFAVHVTYHSGTQEAIYPWCYRAAHAPDFNGLDHLAEVYSTSSGYSNLPYLQSYADYPTNGETIDYSYGVNGTAALTVEISYSKQPPASQIQYYYDLNVPAMMAMIKNAGYGIRGSITDSITGLPVPAAIFINGFFPVFSEEISGYYNKYLIAGTYSVKVVANGYRTKIVDDIPVTGQDSSVIDVMLAPVPGRFAVKTATVVIPGNNPQDEGRTPAITGPPDSVYYSLGKKGWIIVDMQDTVSDINGIDFMIYEGDISPEGYSCYAGRTIDGPWTFIGNGEGTAGFDLASGGISKARFIKVVDDDDGTALANHAGFDLDAIESFYETSFINDKNYQENIKIYPDPVDELLTIVAPDNTVNGEVIIYDATGKIVLRSRMDSNPVYLDVKSLLPGNYCLKISGNKTFVTRKFIKNR